MSTYTQILYQIVFGSKFCTAFLNNENQTELYNYISGIIRNKKCVPYQIGGYSNHLHLVVYLHPAESLSGFVREVKRSSHNWMIKKRDRYQDFPGWQVGYGAFTYDYGSKKSLVNYVENQAEHHDKSSFQEELVVMLKEHDIEFELKYLFV